MCVQFLFHFQFLFEQHLPDPHLSNSYKGMLLACLEACLFESFTWESGSGIANEILKKPKEWLLFPLRNVRGRVIAQ